MGVDHPLLLLCNRIHEPIFMPKGANGQYKFDLPTSFWEEQFINIIKEVERYITTIFPLPDIFGLRENTIRIIDFGEKLDLKEILELQRNDNFSIFNKKHRECFTKLSDMFMDTNTMQELISRAAYCRDRVNPQLFVYALFTTILHHKECRHITIMNPWEIFPDKFIDSSVFSKCRVTANCVPAGKRVAIEIPVDWTATDVDLEHRVAYWREDIGVNIHHWHWHMVYPPSGRREFVDKNRRGELNYYMHHQIMARYTTERFCNGLPPPRMYRDFREPIAEAYFPKLTESNSGRNLPGRPTNMVLQDINRPSDSAIFSIDLMETFRGRIIEAIDTMKVKHKDGTFVELDEKDGIDILANLMEASSLSINKEYYGDFHNMGHDMLSFIHDPDNRFLEGASAMGGQATAMRDPIFYRWHAFVDHIFTLFKDKLPVYPKSKLTFAGISVEDFYIQTPDENRNTITTHWVNSTIDVSGGLNFSPHGSVQVSVQHLDHKAFKYHLRVFNRNYRDMMATVRIFMAPKYDEKGNSLSLNEQRMLMIEMDKKAFNLKRGDNQITINSFDSSVTIPWEATFKETKLDVPLVFDPNSSNYNGPDLCGCGWPLHLLVPKGTERGFVMDLFVMLSEYSLDSIDQEEPDSCTMGVSYCGLRNRLYPDARSMGYPFDRVFRPEIKSWQDFLTDNMKMESITIRFTNKKEQRLSGSPESLRPQKPNLPKPPPLIPGFLFPGTIFPKSSQLPSEEPIGSQLPSKD